MFEESLSFFYLVIYLVSSSTTGFITVGDSSVPAGSYAISIVGFSLKSKSEKATVFISTTRDFENSGSTSNSINIVRMNAQHRMQLGVDVAFFEQFSSSGNWFVSNC